MSATGICIGMTNYLHSFDEATLPGEHSSKTRQVWGEVGFGIQGSPGSRTSFSAAIYGGVLLVEFRWSVKYFIADINLVYARKEQERNLASGKDARHSTSRFFFPGFSPSTVDVFIGKTKAKTKKFDLT